MTYNTIYNNPWERATVTYPYVWWDDGFSTEELQKIIDYCEKDGLERAYTIGLDKEKDKEEIEKIRRCDIKFIKRDNDTGWIFDRLNFIVKSLNDQFYNLNLNGYDAFQYTSYDSAESGTYDWHIDTHLGHENLPSNMHEPRKLSLSLLLNDPEKDYEGGDFLVNDGQEKKVEFKKGRAVAFPSWLLHKVSPVTKGFRKSLVIWVTGPKWQ
jgi:PKHD-type hydroxylase